jgi:hypothetical protein
VSMCGSLAEMGVVSRLRSQFQILKRTESRVEAARHFQGDAEALNIEITCPQERRRVRVSLEVYPD